MRTLACLLVAFLLGGCATNGNPRDPLEPLNRSTHAFNEALDAAILKPAAEGYVKVVPGFAREGVNNFFDNLEDVNTSLQNILQGKPKEGLGDAARFVINTTLGVFGLWDVATPMGLEKHYEDFGQTLGWWGVGSGPYLVLPLFGPTTLRDAPAKIVDPSWYYGEWIGDDAIFWSFWTLEKVRTRANLLKASSIMEGAALDQYTFVRDAWLQRRRNQVFDGNPPRLKDDEE